MSEVVDAARAVAARINRDGPGHSYYYRVHTKSGQIYRGAPPSPLTAPDIEQPNVLSLGNNVVIDVDDIVAIEIRTTDGASEH